MSRDAAVENRSAVGRSAKIVAGGVEALSPGVIRELVKEFEGGAVRFETVGAHGEIEQFPTDRSLKAGVTDAAVQPVVVAVVEVAGLRVSVTNAPAFHDHFADVGLVVAVGVFEKHETR